jgi:hypothetical protein
MKCAVDRSLLWRVTSFVPSNLIRLDAGSLISNSDYVFLNFREVCSSLSSLSRIVWLMPGSITADGNVRPQVQPLFASHAQRDFETVHFREIESELPSRKQATGTCRIGRCWLSDGCVREERTRDARCGTTGLGQRRRRFVVMWKKRHQASLLK